MSDKLMNISVPVPTREVNAERSAIDKLKKIYTEYSDEKYSSTDRKRLWNDNNFDESIKDALDYLICIPAFGLVQELDEHFCVGI